MANEAHLREARRLGSDVSNLDRLVQGISEWLLEIDRGRHPHRNPQAE